MIVAMSPGAVDECGSGRLTNSLTIFEEPFRASLCTLDSSLLDLDDLDLDLEVDFAADVDLAVEELDLDVRAVLGSDMLGSVVVHNGWRGEVVDC